MSGETPMHEEVVKVYGHRLRVRVCGICTEGNGILLVKHTNIGEKGILWAPPGGGVEYGETSEESLKREFREETGLEIEVTRFLFVNEYYQPPLHGIELFFLVNIVGGDLKKGHDPEMTAANQIIQEVCFVDFDHIKSGDPDNYHSFLKPLTSMHHIFHLYGYGINGAIPLKIP